MAHRPTLLLSNHMACVGHSHQCESRKSEWRVEGGKGRILTFPKPSGWRNIGLTEDPFVWAQMWPVHLGFYCLQGHWADSTTEETEGVLMFLVRFHNTNTQFSCQRGATSLNHNLLRPNFPPSTNYRGASRGTCLDHDYSLSVKFEVQHTNIHTHTQTHKIRAD